MLETFIISIYAYTHSMLAAAVAGHIVPFILKNIPDLYECEDLSHVAVISLVHEEVTLLRIVNQRTGLTKVLGLDTATDGASRDLSHTDPTAAVPSPSPHSLPPVLHGVEVSSATTAPSVALICGGSTGGASDLLEAELCIAASQHEHHKCYSAAANAAHCLTRQDSCQSICCYSATNLHVNLLSF